MVLLKPAIKHPIPGSVARHYARAGGPGVGGTFPSLCSGDQDRVGRHFVLALFAAWMVISDERTKLKEVGSVCVVMDGGAVVDAESAGDEGRPTPAEEAEFESKGGRE